MDEHAKDTERVEDLDVPDEESQDVKGGLMPADLKQRGAQKFEKQQPGGLGFKYDVGPRLGDGSV